MTLAWSAILPRAGPAQRPSAAVSKLERIGGGLEMMWSFTSLSKHFIMIGVSVTGR